MAKIGEPSTFQGLINLIKSKLGTAAYKNTPSSGNASTTEVVLGSDSRLTDTRDPKSHTHTVSDISNFPSAMPPTSHTHTVSDISNFPTLGTAAALDVAESGNASTTEVVKGDDTRLTDSRTPTSHTHTLADITDLSGEYRYEIVTKSTGNYDAAITVKKYINDALDTSTDYLYTSLTTPVNFDGLFTLGYSNTKYTMTLLTNSTTHTTGYTEQWMYNASVDLSETFLLDYKDISYIAPTFSALVAYAVNNLVTHEGKVYKCTTPHSAGAWDSSHFTETTVDAELNNKADISDAGVAGGLATLDANGKVPTNQLPEMTTSKIDTKCAAKPKFANWMNKQWTGLTSIYGANVWTDGTNIYYSSGSTQYVLDRSTSTWTTKTWTGLTRFEAIYIWSDGTNIYYSSGVIQYVLDGSTSTWTTKTWTGLTRFDATYIWSDGTNIYCSSGSTQYVLDRSTSTWTTKTWTGLTSIYGANVWTDGTNIYYSSGVIQYVLDRSTSTWTTKTWTGLTRFDATYIWSDGTDIYYTEASTHYVLDRSTSTWTTKTWTGLTSIYVPYIWSDGTDIYYSNGNSQYVLTNK